MHPMYVASHEVAWYGAWLYGVHRTRRDGSSFTWHQPYKQTTLSVHQIGGYLNRAKKEEKEKEREREKKELQSLI